MVLAASTTLPSGTHCCCISLEVSDALSSSAI